MAVDPVEDGPEPPAVLLLRLLPQPPEEAPSLLPFLLLLLLLLLLVDALGPPPAGPGGGREEEGLPLGLVALPDGLPEALEVQGDPVVLTALLLDALLAKNEKKCLLQHGAVYFKV